MNQEAVVRAIAAEFQEAEHDLKFAYDDEGMWAAKGRRLAAARIARALAVFEAEPEIFLQRCGVPKCLN